ncbi:MAG: hypothetical protein AABZ39_06665 [Spirochaetota bacterium]
MKTTEESRAMLEVWEWKEKAAKEVESYDLKTALAMRIKTSMETVHALGLPVVDGKPNKGHDGKKAHN